MSKPQQASVSNLSLEEAEKLKQKFLAAWPQVRDLVSLMKHRAVAIGIETKEHVRSGDAKRADWTRR